MYINLIPVWDKGQRGGGRFFIKEQWEKSLLPLGPDSNNGYLLHWCTKIALKRIHIHIPLVNEVTDKMCKRTGRLTSHGYHFFFRKWIRRNCCRIKPGNKTTCCNIAHRLPLLDCIIYPVDVICSAEGSE